MLVVKESDIVGFVYFRYYRNSRNGRSWMFYIKVISNKIG